MCPIPDDFSRPSDRPLSSSVAFLYLKHEGKFWLYVHTRTPDAPWRIRWEDEKMPGGIDEIAVAEWHNLGAECEGSVDPYMEPKTGRWVLLWPRAQLWLDRANSKAVIYPDHSGLG